MLNLITPHWPAPQNIHAYCTTRAGGFSQAPYSSFNLGMNVEDKEEHVLANRQLLQERLQLPNSPIWLQQFHSTEVVRANTAAINTRADAAFTAQKNIVCVVTTADCLPLLITDRAGSHVAAVHAGWRGLAAGIIEATLKKLALANDELLVWLGPAIGPKVFEVGDEVYAQFCAHAAEAKAAFTRNANQRWLADIYLLARQRLLKQGVTQIYGGDYCTFSDRTRFYSYRRDGSTGRMASLIWRS